MSDSYDPTNGEMCDPELLQDYCNGVLKPIVDRSYGGDFSDSQLGDRVTQVVIRGGFKVYFDAVCELEYVSEDGETVVYATQTLYLYIGMLVVDESIRQELIDVLSIAKLDDVLDAILSSSSSEDGDGDVPLATELDGEDEIDYTNVRAWRYLRLVFDLTEGSLCEADRYHALDTYDDNEIVRSPIMPRANQESNDGPEAEDEISQEEFGYLRIATSFMGM